MKPQGLTGSSKALFILALVVPLLATPLWAAVGVDATVSRDQGTASTSVATPAFSTVSGNELLLAFVSADRVSSPNTTVTNISGGGLTWVLVRRTNVQFGTAEIWRAFSVSPLSAVVVTATLSQRVVSSMTVMSFTGVDTSGTGGSGAIGATGTGNANPGAPSATLVTTRGGSLVLGVGNDFDNAIARTLGPGQSSVHQNLPTIGDTYWVQRASSPTPLGGTSVTINDTAPAGDRYNLSIVEVLEPAGGGASTFTVSGALVPAGSGSGATVTLTQNGTTVAAVTADSSGNYGFANLANGNYSVTPSKSGFTFSPTTQAVTVNGANVTVPTFTAAAVTWSISGAITPVTSGAGTLITLSGAASATRTADVSGGYNFAGLQNGNYTVTPSKTGFTFTPSFQNVSINGANPPSVNFTATAVQTFSISGHISPTSSGAGTLLTLSGSPSGTTTADASANYSFSGLGNGSYTVTPTKTGFTFNPSSATVPIGGADMANIDFTITPLPPPALNYPDLSDIIPAGQISIVGSGASRMFQYTHDTFNGGSGPLVIQPVYNPASGNYQGIQYVYSFSGGRWTLSQQIPLAGAFIFHAVHGHFHFPFSSYGLYAVDANGGIGSPVVLSTKIGFCINDSFIYDPSLPNAGALGNLGSCSDPTSLRGLNIGAVDEYDRTDEGQSISLANVPDGDYWLRAIVDPNNFFAESNKSNNETDVKVRITGTTVQVLQTVTPVLPPLASIQLTTPATGTTLAGTVNLEASTPVTTGVQFLLDGLTLGGVVTTTPYQLAWNTTGVPNGSHWLAVQTTDSNGRTSTSTVALVTVANGLPQDTTPPTVQVSDPEPAATVFATTPISATAADDTGVVSLQFYIDDVALGNPLTAPPYIIYWNTLTVPDGQHTITASATDTVGHIGTSPSVTVTVDNSHPSNVLGKDTTVFVDGSGTMQTALFSTVTAGDLLVAFVAYDGPLGAPQTAAVSGAGLTWTLLKRSNVQAGTAEIWSARASGVLTNVRVMSQPGTGTGNHGSMTVIAFTNAAGPGVVGQASAPSGAPDIFLPGVTAGDWVFAVGNDWDRAVARVPVSGQVLVHQRVDTAVGDTFWVQSTAAPSTANALVDIHDSSPTADQWNYAAVEIVATRQ